MGSKQFTLTEVINMGIQATLLETHTAIPGEIQSYDAATQTAQVRIAIDPVIEGEPAPYPILDRIPVCFPRSKGYGITFPLAKGDSVLLVFGERNTDRWRSIGAGEPPNDARRFDISDAVVIPGYFPKSGVMSPEPVDGTGIIGDKIFIGDPEATPTAPGLTKVDLVEAVAEALKALLTAVYPSAMGPAGPMAPPESATITNIQADIEGLKT